MPCDIHQKNQFDAEKSRKVALAQQIVKLAAKHMIRLPIVVSEYIPLEDLGDAVTVAGAVDRLWEQYPSEPAADSHEAILLKLLNTGEIIEVRVSREASRNGANLAFDVRYVDKEWSNWRIAVICKGNEWMTGGIPVYGNIPLVNNNVILDVGNDDLRPFVQKLMSGSKYQLIG